MLGILLRPLLSSWSRIRKVEFGIYSQRRLALRVLQAELGLRLGVDTSDMWAVKTEAFVRHGWYGTCKKERLISRTGCLNLVNLAAQPRRPNHASGYLTARRSHPRRASTSTRSSCRPLTPRATPTWLSPQSQNGSSVLVRSSGNFLCSEHCLLYTDHVRQESNKALFLQSPFS